VRPVGDSGAGTIAPGPWRMHRHGSVGSSSDPTDAIRHLPLWPTHGRPCAAGRDADSHPWGVGDTTARGGVRRRTTRTGHRRPSARQPSQLAVLEALARRLALKKQEPGAPPPREHIPAAARRPATLAKPVRSNRRPDGLVDGQDQVPRVIRHGRDLRAAPIQVDPERGARLPGVVAGAVGEDVRRRAARDRGGPVRLARERMTRRPSRPAERATDREVGVVAAVLVGAAGLGPVEHASSPRR
jgi:hypothetical protein